MNDTAPREIFLYRLFALQCFGIALITAGYAGHFAWVRGPRLHATVLDFDTKLPWLSAIVLSAPWLALILPIAALIFGAVAILHPRRWLLVVALAFTLLAVTAMVIADTAATGPLWGLTRSLS